MLLCRADCGWRSPLCSSWPSPPAASPPSAASPLAGGDSSGWGGKPRQGCTWLETPRAVGRAARRASRGPRALATRPRAVVLRSLGEGQEAAGTDSQELAEPAARVQVLRCPPRRRGSPSPAEDFPPEQPREAASRRHRCVRLFEWFFSHKTALKKGNEKRPASWLRFALEGCFSPAALLLCCNTGNLLLLTPGVASNSQMVLTSVSYNWWPTCLTL